MCIVEDIEGNVIAYRNEQCASGYLQSMNKFQFNVGWITLGVFGINITVNMAAITWGMIKNTYRSLAKRYPKLKKLKEKLTWKRKKKEAPVRDLRPWTIAEMQNLAVI